MLNKKNERTVKPSSITDDTSIGKYSNSTGLCKNQKLLVFDRHLSEIKLIDKNSESYLSWLTFYF